MLLGYFSEEAYDSLLQDISTNADKYSSDADWLSEYFEGKSDFFQTSSVEMNMFTPQYTPGKKTDEQKTHEDLINTQLLYDAFRSLTPHQATNKYMWTYLCHAIPKYREYIRDRWMQDARENTIKSRFFVTTSEALLNYNALSRLWWYGYLTYDINNENHYALTEVLLTNQTICKDVMDTFNRMNHERITGVLLAIRDFKAILGGNEGITEYFRECKKYLNHYAAVTVLEFLDSKEIRDLAFNYMMKLRTAKQKGNDFSM